MKKHDCFLATILVLCMVLIAIPVARAFAEESDIEALTVEKWINSTNISFVVHEDGTMDYYAGTLHLSGNWTYNAPIFVFSYELYGSRTLTLTLNNIDGYWMLTNEEGALFMHESEFASAQKAANVGVSGYALKMGEKVELPFVSFTIETSELANLVGGENAYFPAAEGYKLFVLKGTIENQFGGELKVGTMRSQFIFNDQYTYSGEVRLYTTAGLSSLLQPMTSAELYIYAQIPDAMVDQLTKADVLFSFNDSFANAPIFVADGTYIFEIKVDEEKTSVAKEGPAFERVTFEECPILPKPESYASVYQSGKNKSSSNGKTSKIKYSYRIMGNNGSITELRALYLKKLQEEGYSVEDLKSEALISWRNTKLATITISGDSLSVDIVPGNENLKATQEISNTGSRKVYSPNETIIANTAEIKLEKNYTTGQKVFSNRTGQGSHEYYVAENDPYFIVYGSFKNTGKEPVDIINIYAAVIIDDEYFYRADVSGVSRNASSFVRDVAAQGSLECVIYAEIPTTVLNQAKTIVVKLGFTDDFSYKAISSGSLPLFDRCDQVFEIKMK